MLNEPCDATDAMRWKKVFILMKINMVIQYTLSVIYLD